ncbi:MerR family transcriptional regulator [Devosia sp.]|uniref:MerR family transcriptional regulator n=1 Tax=Devosia sp. TaxID=1871048 RepID=UPI003A947E4C
MNASDRFYSPAEAAARLGISGKALRLYEQHGLLAPVRSAAGWRSYGPEQMARAGEIAALRGLGLSLKQVGCVRAGEGAALEPALAAHQTLLEREAQRLAACLTQVRGLRSALLAGQAPELEALAGVLPARGTVQVAFELPWPWGGERFELRDIRPLTYLVGPLGSGKTQLARRLAAAISGAVFIGLERTSAALDTADDAQRQRVEAALEWLEGEGATPSDALVALLVAMECAATAVVVDLVEQGLDQATQEALGAWLRRRATVERPLFVMTRSSTLLDMTGLSDDEAVLFCPANHSPPVLVPGVPGAPGYEAVTSCLATPEVRARTEGVVVMRQDRA